MFKYDMCTYTVRRILNPENQHDCIKAKDTCINIWIYKNNNEQCCITLNCYVQHKFIESYDIKIPDEFLQKLDPNTFTNDNSKQSLKIPYPINYIYAYIKQPVYVNAYLTGQLSLFNNRYNKILDMYDINNIMGLYFSIYYSNLHYLPDNAMYRRGQFLCFNDTTSYIVYPTNYDHSNYTQHNLGNLSQLICNKQTNKYIRQYHK